jgi:ubiquinone/menaquinone biosynthesis C-methylase UbiE
VTFGQRFARFATDAVVRHPALWRLFRRPMRRQFDRLAPQWDAMRRPDMLAPLEAALDRLPSPPQRVLDVGTGTGVAARLVGSRFPEAEVVGVDVADRMLDEARRLTDSQRISFRHGDSERLPFDAGSFDLVTLNNMIPFFDELARVTAPGGNVIVAFTMGDRTPIYVPFSRVRSELERRGFSHVADFDAGTGTALLAKKRDPS